MSTDEPFFAHWSDDPVERIQRTIEFLRLQEAPNSAISKRLATYMADALEESLAGRRGSIEHALGLKAGTGKPGAPPKSLADLEANEVFQIAIRAAPYVWARDVQAAKGKPQKPWREICEQIGFGIAGEELLRNEKELPKIWNRYGARVVDYYAAQIAAAMSDN